MNQLAIKLLLVFGLMMLGGCASWFGNWFGGKDTSVQPAPLVEFKPTIALKLKWQVNTGSAQTAFFSPALDGENVFVAAADGQLMRIDRATGRVQWQVVSGKKLSGGVGAGDNLVLVGTAKGQVLAYDQTGKLLWQSELSSEILAAPKVAEGIVVARTGDGKVFGLSAEDGKTRWVYQRAVPALSLRTAAGILIHRGAVFVGFAGGKLVALSLSSGNVGWEATVALPKGATELERIADVSSTPVTDGRNVYAVAYQGKVVSLDITNGTLIWSRDISSASGLAIDQQNIYVSEARGSVHALTKSNGTSVWKQDKLTARALSAPAVSDKFVAVGDVQGYVHILSVEDGGFAQRAATDATAIRVPPVSLANGFIFQSEKGGVFAFEI